MSSYYWTGYLNYQTSATATSYSWCPHLKYYTNCYKQDCKTCTVKLEAELKKKKTDEEDID